MAKRRSPTARVGNYTAPVDTSGLDPSMKSTMGMATTKRMNSTESRYVAGAPNKSTAMEAVRRTRRANKMPGLPE